MVSVIGPDAQPLGLHEIIVAVGQFGEPLAGEARRARGDVQRAGGRVLAEQRALRAAQLLDLLDVGKVERGGGWPGVVNLIDIETDARLQPVVRLADGDDARSQTADGESGVARVGRAVVQRGDQRRQTLRVDRIALVDEVAAHHRQGCGHALRILRPAARGDDDVGQAILPDPGRSRSCSDVVWAKDGCAERRHDRRTQKTREPLRHRQ
jgi:hypothetical protein